MTTRIVFFILCIPFLSLSQLSEKDKNILRNELTEQINELRESLGVKPLLLNDTLREAAAFHSEYMAKRKDLSHEQVRAKYRTPRKRVDNFNGEVFDIVGENILYTKPQSFPLRKKELIALANEMFTNWKNSPPHYANMIDPEYVYADLGFKTEKRNSIVYATHVFGKKGFKVKNQLSENAFGLKRAAEDCEEEYETFSNLVMNIGNDMKIEGNEVVFYYHDISYFNKIFSNANDGIAIDLVSKDQLECGKPNELDAHAVYDGILLEPTYRDEMLKNNRAKSNYRVITKVGEIPPELQGKPYETSIAIIKNGKVCKYLTPSVIPAKKYALRPIEPIVEDEPGVDLIKQGIIGSQIVNYDFETSITRPIKQPNLWKGGSPIHSVKILSYSSVEGDSVNNQRLHNSRAAYIQNHILRNLNVDKSIIEIDAKENWALMDFQLNYFDQKELLKLTHDSIKSFLEERDESLPWDSLLLAQRRATAIINYQGEYIDSTSIETLGEFNLRTAIVMNKPKLVNKALYEMYHSDNVNPYSVFKPHIRTYIENHPSTISNYAALLSKFYRFDPYEVSSFIHNCLVRAEDLPLNARYNILHLYTLIGSYFIDNWDISAERLSNVIHPRKIEQLGSEKIDDQLTLNLHLTFIDYFGQINDGPNISRSFNFIAEYFKTRSLSQKDDVDLALFFNSWSMYSMTLSHLKSRLQENNLSEDGLFVLAQTMNFTNYGDESGEYIAIHKKALESNPERWCKWIDIDFQVKRNHKIKRFYCETCN